MKIQRKKTKLQIMKKNKAQKNKKTYKENKERGKKALIGKR